MDWLHYIYLAFFVIKISRLRNVYLREQNIRKIRHLKIEEKQDRDYLYIWFLAQEISCRNLTGLVEAKNFILKKANRLKLPMYMETTDKRLLTMYKRCGFVFYESLKDTDSNLQIWFGRYESKE